MHADYIAFIGFVWLSKQRVTSVLYISNRLVFIIVVESVYSSVRTESLYNTDRSCNLKGNFTKTQGTIVTNAVTIISVLRGNLPAV
jgi:hypothetical protein